MAHGGVEVANVIDAAIVLAGSVFKLNTNPEARGKSGPADEADDACSKDQQLVSKANSSDAECPCCAKGGSRRQVSKKAK